MTAAAHHIFRSRWVKLLAVLSFFMLSTASTQAQEAGMLWTCSSTADGKWVCTGNEEVVNEAANTPATETSTAEATDKTATSETTTAEKASTEVTTTSTVTATSTPSSSSSEAATTTRTTTTATATATATKTAASTPTQAIDDKPTAVSSTSTAESAGKQTYTPNSVESSPDEKQSALAAHQALNERCDAKKDPSCILDDRSLKTDKPSLSELQSYPATYPQAFAKPTPQQLTQDGKGKRNTVSALTRDTKRTNTPGFEWNCRPSSQGNGWDCNQDPVSLAGSIARQDSNRYQTRLPASAFPYAFLDWYSYSDGKAHPTTHCAGTYIQPEFKDASDPDDESTFVNADQSKTTDNNFTTLSGNVHLNKGNKHLYAQEAAIDHDRELATFQGKVIYREPDTLMLSQNAQFDQQQGTTELNQVEFVFHGQSIRGDAERVVKLDNEDVYITDGRYTRCEPGNEDWVLSGSEIVLYQEEGYGVAKHATIRVAGIPVFYMPYFTFPIDDRRKSGFLFPSAGYTKDNGVDIAAPYYFNIAPNIDDTLTPRYLGERGLMLENEFRYLNESGFYELNLGFLPNDDLYGKDRWLLGINHSGSPFDNTRTFIDYNAVSDNDYFDDLSTNLNISKETHLDKLIGMNYSGDGWNASAKLHGYQTITTANKPYQKLPELNFSGSEQFKDDQIGVSYSATHTNFYRDNSSFTGIDAATGQRFHGQASASTDFTWPWAYIRPKATLAYTQYQLSDQPTTTEESPSRTLPIFSVDSGIYLDREMTIGDKRYTHTLEPRLFYLYVPYEDQSDLPEFDSSELSFSYGQLFRENRFSGRDRIGDANQLTLGLTNRILEDNGAELGHISVGQIFYFEDRQVRLDKSAPELTNDISNFAAEGLWQVSKHMRFTGDAEWENNDFTLIKRNLKLSYNSDRDHQFNLGYRYTEGDLEQAEASMIWPLNGNWSVVGRWLQDLEEKEALDQIVGLEYENCCWRVRTVFRSWVDDDADDRKNNGIFLQFTLKGLGTVGTQATGDGGPSANDFLEEITGFKERELYDD